LDQLNQNIVAEGLAGKHHISRMTALLTNIELYEKMLDDSMDSQGSALKENEVYMESIEARINRMRQSMEQLALSVGDAFLTEGFIQFLNMLTDFGKMMTSVTKEIGFLPIALGGVSVAVA